MRPVLVALPPISPNRVAAVVSAAGDSAGHRLATYLVVAVVVGVLLLVVGVVGLIMTRDHRRGRHR